MAYNRSKNIVSNQIVNFSGLAVKLLKKVGEGGYSYVYEAIDINERKSYAVKQVSILDRKHKEISSMELNALKQLKGCEYIVKYYGDTIISNYHFILIEFCPAPLFEYIQKRLYEPFSDTELLKLCGQTTKAVAYMHSQNPPLINRDLKVDNLLFGQDGRIRLCDFGSFTTEKVDPSSLTHQQKCSMEEKLKEYTSPNYRAPEMLDLYLNYVIGEKADIWALGCIYYFLCYFNYPFEDGSRLAILNNRYKKLKSQSSLVDTKICPIISSIFVTNPDARPSAVSLSEFFFHSSTALGIRIDEPIINVEAYQPDSNFMQTTQTVLDNALSKAGNFIGTLKEKGQKFKAQISQSNAKKSKPFNKVTSRIGTMACPNVIKSGVLKNFDKSSAKLLAEYLNSNYNGSYAIVNLINSAEYPISLFNNRVLTYNMSFDQAPNLVDILELLKRVVNYLLGNEKRIILFHCKDGGYLSHYFACLLLIYTRALSDFENFFQTILSIRSNIIISPAHSSFIRYANYVEKLVNNPKYNLLDTQILINRIKIYPVFFCNRTKTCCRPFVTISVGGSLIYSSIANSETIKEFYERDKFIEIPIQLTVSGDIQISLYHVSHINKKFVQKRIFSTQFNTMFLTDTSLLQFTCPQLDVRDSFLFEILKSTTVEISLHPYIATNLPSVDISKFSVLTVSPYVCFKNPTECNDIISLCNDRGSQNFIENRLQSLSNLSLFNSQKIQKDEILPKNLSQDIRSAVISSPLDIINGTPILTEVTPKEKRQFDEHLSPDLMSMIELNSSQHSQNENQTLDSLNMFTEVESPISPKQSTNESEDMISFNNSNFPPKSTSMESLLSSLSVQSTDFVNPFATQSQNKPRFFTSLQENIHTNKNDSLVNASPNIFINLKEKIPLHPSETYPIIGISEFKIPSVDIFSNQNQANTYFQNTTSSSSQKTPAVGDNVKPSIERKKPSIDPFGDIFNHAKFAEFPGSQTASGYYKPPSMAEAKRLQDEFIEQDPAKKMVKEWCKGKRKNIRALLANLHLILWQTDKWTPVSLHEMTDGEQVKKLYRKACLCIHPDKHVNTPNEELARAIFCELSESYGAFESSGGKVFY